MTSIETTSYVLFYPCSTHSGAFYKVMLICGGFSSEILRKAKINNIVAGNMYKAGVDTLANIILNDPLFPAMLMASALNES